MYKRVNGLKGHSGRQVGEIRGGLEARVAFPTAAGLAAFPQIPNSSSVPIPQQCPGWQGQEPGRVQAGARASSVTGIKQELAAEPSLWDQQ